MQYAFTQQHWNLGGLHSTCQLEPEMLDPRLRNMRKGQTIGQRRASLKLPNGTFLWRCWHQLVSRRCVKPGGKHQNDHRLTVQIRTAAQAQWKSSVVC